MWRNWLARWRWIWFEPRDAPLWIGMSRLPTRSAEILLAALMLSIGLTLAAPGSTFDLPHWAVMRQWVTEPVLAFHLVAFGFIRCGAIISDTRFRFSPVIRVMGCCAGAGFWVTVFLAIEEASELWASGAPMLLPIAIVCALFETYAAMRGGTDAANLDSFGVRERAFNRRHGRDAGSGA